MGTSNKPNRSPDEQRTVSVPRRKVEARSVVQLTENSFRINLTEQGSEYHGIEGGDTLFVETVDEGFLIRPSWLVEHE